MTRDSRVPFVKWVYQLLLIALVAVQPFVRAADDVRAPTDQQVLVDLRSRLNDTKTSEERGMLLENALRDASEQMLRGLSVGNGDGLALSAYWQLSKARVHSRRAHRLGPAAQDTAAVAMFCGFVDGRYGTSVPEWWQKAFISGSHERTAPAIREPKNRVSAPADSIDRVATTLDTHITSDGNLVEIAVGTRTVRMRPELRKEIRANDSFEKWLIRFGDGVCYFAPCSETGCQSHVYAIDSATGAKKWVCDLWALGTQNLGGISGAWWHDVELVISNERLLVFGAGPGVVYIDAFSIRDGTCAFRFNSINWFAGNGNGESE
jgi:hypothetical protein